MQKCPKTSAHECRICMIFLKILIRIFDFVSQKLLEFRETGPGANKIPDKYMHKYIGFCIN